MTAENLPHSLSETQIPADEAAGLLFDYTVDEALAGRVKNVVITWHDDVDENGEAYESHRVTIDGRAAQSYARRLVEYTTTDEVFIESASKAFAESMATMWENTMAYYRELDELSLHVDLIATDSNAGFWDQAKADLTAETPVGPLDSRLIHAAARTLACTAIVEWAEAVEASEAQE